MSPQAEEGARGLGARFRALLSRRRTLLAWTRRLVLLVVVVMAALLVRRYDLEGWRPELAGLGDSVRRNLVVYADVDEDTVLGRGTLVEAEGTVVHDGESLRGLYVARIEGEPGERLELRPLEGGAAEIVVGGRRTWTRVPGRSPLEDGAIPPGHYLLLLPVSDAPGWDSRTLGLVPRAAFRRKIIASL